MSENEFKESIRTISISDNRIEEQRDSNVV